MLTARQVSLGRLRLSVVRRMRPLSSRLPLLEHATAVLDARVLTTVFTVWARWCAAVRGLRARGMRALVQRCLDR